MLVGGPTRGVKMNKALVIVDMQKAFLDPLPIGSVDKLIRDIQERAKRANKLGWKVIPVEFHGSGPTISDLTFPFSEQAIKKKTMGGGNEVVNKHPGLDVAEVVGVYSDQCVMCTASGMVKRNVKANLRLDHTLPYYAENPKWKSFVKETIETYIGRYHKDTSGLFQIV